MVYFYIAGFFAYTVALSYFSIRYGRSLEAKVLAEKEALKAAAVKQINKL